METYLIKGEYVQWPYRKFGYSQVHGGENPDPGSKRQKLKWAKKEKGGKKGGKSLKNHTNGNGKIGSQDTAVAPPVTEFSPIHSLDNKIFVLYGKIFGNYEMDGVSAPPA